MITSVAPTRSSTSHTFLIAKIRNRNLNNGEIVPESFVEFTAIHHALS